MVYNSWRKRISKCLRMMALTEFNLYQMTFKQRINQMYLMNLLPSLKFYDALFRAASIKWIVSTKM